MTSVFKKILVIFTACCLCVCSLASCSGGIDKDEAKAFVANFFDAVEAEDYEKAETFLHPDRPADLEEYFLNIEESTLLDFQAGIEIQKHTGFSSSFYDSTVDGSIYTPIMSVKIGETVVKIAVQIVKNENGYGIYNLDIDT